MNEATREIGIVSTMINVALQRPRKTKTTSITMKKVMKIVSLRLFTVLTMKSEVSIRYPTFTSEGREDWIWGRRRRISLAICTELDPSCLLTMMIAPLLPLT